MADGKKLDEAAMAKRDIVDAPEVTQGMEQEAEVKAEAVQKAVEQAVEPSLDVAKAASVFSEGLADIANQMFEEKIPKDRADAIRELANEIVLSINMTRPVYLGFLTAGVLLPFAPAVIKFIKTFKSSSPEKKPEIQDGAIQYHGG